MRSRLQGATAALLLLLASLFRHGAQPDRLSFCGLSLLYLSANLMSENSVPVAGEITLYNFGPETLHVGDAIEWDPSTDSWHKVVEVVVLSDTNAT